MTRYRCTIGDDVLVGMGATVLNGATIGDGCLIGAGALVTEGKVFPTRNLIVGAPARAVWTLPLEKLRLSAAYYVARAKACAAGLERVR